MTKQEAINHAHMNFQQICMVEMITAWVVDSPDSERLVNYLVETWKTRQMRIAKDQAKANFEKTGIIDTSMGEFEQAIAIAEAQIRERFAEAIRQSRAREEQIQEWLGEAYDAERVFSGNPDYRNDDDIDDLIARIKSVIRVDLGPILRAGGF